MSDAAPTAKVAARETWREALFNRRMVICIFVGFSPGLPLYLLINLLPAWLRSEGVDLKTIGLFTLTGAVHLEVPLVAAARPLRAAVAGATARLDGRDAGRAVRLDRRAGLFHPGTDIWTIAYLSIAIAFFSASFDIAADAFRRELLPEAEFGLGNSFYVNAYRISSLVPGSLALILADRMPWSSVFVVTALFMLPGIAMTLMVSEPHGLPRRAHAARGRRRPFREFFTRSGWQNAVLVLLFIFLYKLGDSMATALATPFYLDMGFSPGPRSASSPRTPACGPAWSAACWAGCGW